MYILTKKRGPWETIAEVRDRGEQRPLCAAVDGNGVFIRQKGRRESSAFFVPWGLIWLTGAKLKAAEYARLKREAQAARKAQRAADERSSRRVAKYIRARAKAR